MLQYYFGMSLDSNPGIKRRLPAIERSINEIHPEKDVRVRLLGTVINTAQNSLMIDDGSGKLEISFDRDISSINQGQVIRVITRVLPLIDGFECKGECIQTLDNFDISLFKRAKEVVNNSGVW